MYLFLLRLLCGPSPLWGAAEVSAGSEGAAAAVAGGLFPWKPPQGCTARGNKDLLGKNVAFFSLNVRNSLIGLRVWEDGGGEWWKLRLVTVSNSLGNLSFHPKYLKRNG